MNHYEQEWRFLVTKCPRIKSVPGVAIRQGYLSESGLTVRSRQYGDQGFLTIKSMFKTADEGPIARKEFEYAIPLKDAQELIELSPASIVKTRYTFPNGFEIDFFHDRFEGLIIAEFEIHSDEYLHQPPPPMKGMEWINITNDARYSNKSLSFGELPADTPSCILLNDLEL
ncbi:MAG: CYTH domain-containing protein [Sumerlaeia bacterium]